MYDLLQTAVAAHGGLGRWRASAGIIITEGSPGDSRAQPEKQAAAREGELRGHLGGVHVKGALFEYAEGGAVFLDEFAPVAGA